MSEYKVGYGKPPLSSRFKPGVSGNPKGRPKREMNSLSESVLKVLSSPIKYRERGRTKPTTYGALFVQILVDGAVGGDVDAAKRVLRAYARAERCGDGGIDNFVIKNWLTDVFPGERKAQDAFEGEPEAGAKLDDRTHPPKSEAETD